MTAVFNRQISVLFVAPGNTDFISLDETAKFANIGFTVERNLDAEPSTALITIHNLSKDTQQQLSRTKDWSVEIVAGYGNNTEADFRDNSTGLIFKGDVRFVRHRREPPVVYTDIEADDGGAASKKVVSKHFGKGVTVGTVFKYLQEQSGLGAGYVERITQINKPDGLPDRLKNGVTLRGYVMDEISDLARSRGAKISSQGNELIVLAPGEPLAGVPLTEISPSTGLIGYPYVDNEGIMTLNHRLLPNVFPGSPLDIESEFVNGRYVVERAVYSGSLWGDDFNIEVEGVAVA